MRYSEQLYFYVKQCFDLFEDKKYHKTLFFCHSEFRDSWNL